MNHKRITLDSIHNEWVNARGLSSHRLQDTSKILSPLVHTSHYIDNIVREKNTGGLCVHEILGPILPNYKKLCTYDNVKKKKRVKAKRV